MPAGVPAGTKFHVGVVNAIQKSSSVPADNLIPPTTEDPKSGKAIFLGRQTVEIKKPSQKTYNLAGALDVEVTDVNRVYIVYDSVIDAGGAIYTLTSPRAILCHLPPAPPPNSDPKKDSVILVNLVLDVVYKREDIDNITGKVVRASGTDLIPLPNVPVKLLNAGRTKVLAETISDASGAYFFETMEIGRLVIQCQPNVEASSGQHFTKTPETEFLRPMAGPVELPDILYQPVGATVIGRAVVKDASGFSGLKGVTVRAIFKATGKEDVKTVSNGLGIFELEITRAGRYLIVFDNEPEIDGKGWQLVNLQDQIKEVQVAAGQNLTIDPVEYAPEEHKIVWTVLRGGVPAPDTLVEVYRKDSSGNPLKEFLQQRRTDLTGKVEFLLDREGPYQLKVYAEDPTTGKPAEIDVEVHSTFAGKTEFAAPRGPTASGIPGAPAAPATDVSGALDNTQAYPLLTGSVGLTSPALSGGQAGASTTSLARMAENAVRDVLGWRPKSSDTKGFVEALTRSFDVREVEGHTEWTWMKRGYAVKLQDDLGAISGAQASIYSRAKAALSETLPMLDSLFSFRPDVRPDDIEAIRVVVRSEFSELVSELGTVGGPRVQRVDELFGFLIGPATGANADPEKTAGHLGELRERLGMKRSAINTAEDEQNLTNYLILVDYILALRQSWENQRKFFARGNGGAAPYLGTQLVLVSQALTAIAENTTQLDFAMKSVFLGDTEQPLIMLQYAGKPAFSVIDIPGDDDPGQRQGTFQFSANASALSVAELMDWVEQTAIEESPRLIQDAGKDGVIAIFPTLNKLRKLVRGALIAAQGGLQDERRLPKGYATPRVQRALMELANQLDEAARLAGEIKVQDRRPAINPFTQSLQVALENDPVLVEQLRNVLAPDLAQIQALADAQARNILQQVVADDPELEERVNQRFGRFPKLSMRSAEILDTIEPNIPFITRDTR
jgi:hypothetical protein